MAAIATWSFGQSVIFKAKSQMSDNTEARNIILDSMSEFENDVTTGQYIVGRGGFPNANGVLECDAAIMDGQTFGFGAVAALRGIATPILVAGAVMVKSKHNFLVGEGALQFAKEQGFSVEPNDDLVGEASLQAYQEFKQRDTVPKSVDTLGLIVQDTMLNIAAGVSSSGVAFKHPGRVGDSPLPGSGLYADNDIGAACVTGDGDKILKFCPSYHVVSAMGRGLSPREACQSAVDIIMKKCPSCEIGIIAMNKKGEFGAATTINEWTDIRTGRKYAGFPYVVYSESSGQIETRIAKPNISEEA